MIKSLYIFEDESGVTVNTDSKNHTAAFAEALMFQRPVPPPMIDELPAKFEPTERVPFYRALYQRRKRQ